MKSKKFWAGACAANVLAAALLLSGCGGKELQMSTGEAKQGTVETTVMATGTIQPVEKVEVGTQVSGIINDIFVDFNSTVKAGDLLAELDTQTLLENVSKARASLESAAADEKYAQATYDRTKRLFDAKAATQVALEDASNGLTRASTALVNARANLKQANVNLSYARITSPIDGVVMNRAVERGQTVASSFNTPTLFTIAKDLTKMQVEAAVDEADIGKVKVGQGVTFDVDAYPGDMFTGTVLQVRIEPVVASNVVTYTVIIEAPNPDLKLFPGMTANIYIVTERSNGIIVPVEALYFKMTSDVAKNLGVNAGTAVAETPKSNAGGTPPIGPDMPPMGGFEGGAPASGTSGGRAGKTSAGMAQQMWVSANGKWEARTVKTGLQDGVNIVIEEGIAEGQQVILSAEMVKTAKNRGEATRNPLMPGRRRR